LLVPAIQETLEFGPILNSGLFSNHWLENRLVNEPDWPELENEAAQALHQVAHLWKIQKPRVERYGDEHGLEEGFIQPVFRASGWKRHLGPELEHSPAH
jgi:hypothetical protein